MNVYENMARILRAREGFKATLEDAKEIPVSDSALIDEVAKDIALLYNDNTSKTNLLNYLTNVTEFKIPLGTTKIRKNMFQSVPLTNRTLKIPTSVTYIDNYAFASVDAPTPIFEDYHNISFGQYVFNSANNITELVIPEGCTTIGAYTFYNMKGLQKLVLPSTLSNITGSTIFNGISANGTFNNLPITIGCIGSGCNYEYGFNDIPNYAFAQLRINSFEFNDNCTKFNTGVFMLSVINCDINIPDTVTTIGGSLFYSATVDAACTITFGTGVTVIPYRCIASGTFKASNVIFMGDIKSIEGQAFYQIKSYAVVVDMTRCTAIPVLQQVNSIYDCGTGSALKIVVPQSLFADWKKATNWSSHATKIYYRNASGNLVQS